MKSYYTIHAKNGTFKNISMDIKNLLGYDPKELIGLSPISYFHPKSIKKITDSHLETVLSPNSDPLNQYSSSVTYRFRSKSGKYVWVETISNRIDDDNFICLTTLLSPLDRILRLFK